VAKLRHIAFISPEPKTLSDFYQKHFALEEIKVFPSGSRMVIDGLFNLAFLKRRDKPATVTGTHRADGAELEREPGIHHYGFMVDNLDHAVAKLPASLNRGTSPQASDGVGGAEGARPAEMRFVDPWGNNVDLSARGFLGREERKLPGVRLAVLQVADLEAARVFYQSQFDLTLLGRDANGSIRLSDGTITLRLTREQIRGKGGIQYFGIEVANLDAVKNSLQGSGVALSELASGAVQFNDPEGNRVEISERGWAHQ
jgi:catechol 2,3-dioxygenase-like lactoylglutathione lyase family enzyme